MSDALVRLARLDACAVSDALDALGISGAVSGLPRRATDQRVVGRTVTVKLVAKDEAPAADGPPRHLGTAAVERATADDVIVVEQRTGIDAGSWGGILSLGAKLRGVRGIIADGPVRDVDEARAIGLPIFARATTARTARGRVAEAGTNVPVRIGEVEVRPGDYVIADDSGVVFIPAARIEEALERAEGIARREAAMAAALLRGEPASAVMGAGYEHMLTRHPSGEPAS
jgi:regulator of RNase E activity RraA